MYRQTVCVCLFLFVCEEGEGSLSLGWGVGLGGGQECVRSSVGVILGASPAAIVGADEGRVSLPSLAHCNCNNLISHVCVFVFLPRRRQHVTCLYMLLCPTCQFTSSTLEATFSLV